jgi:hypothetical protein
MGCQVYTMDDISMASDSGWRGKDEMRTASLVEDVQAGKYGAGNFCSPSLLMSSTTDEPILSSLDGKAVLDNGKSTISALMRLKATLNFTSCPIS